MTRPDELAPPESRVQEVPALPTQRVERAPTKGANTARHLAQYIIDNKIEPGTTLPPEKALSASFGIGRGTMNDALRILENYGLLELRPGRYGGPVVRRPDAANLASSLTLAFYANGSSLVDVMDARQMVEPTLVGLAAKRITVDELDALRAILPNMRRPEVTEDSMIADTGKFLHIVFEAAGSPVLSLLVEGLQHIIAARIVPVSFKAKELRGIADDHEAVIDALDRRDPEGAKSIWMDHLRRADEYFRTEHAKVARQPIVWSL
jgi:GntR family transcriptional repressor for pyruvate dehydrogenase complex